MSSGMRLAESGRSFAIDSRIAAHANRQFAPPHYSQTSEHSDFDPENAAGVMATPPLRLGGSPMSKDPARPAPSNVRTRAIAKLRSTAPGLNRVPNGKVSHAVFTIAPWTAE
jgi:hypothetical protein